MITVISAIMFPSILIIFILLGLNDKYNVLNQRKALKTTSFTKIKEENKPFYLYLRAFEEDGEKYLPSGANIYDVYEITGKTLESEIADALPDKLLITVGRPNEEFPYLGATRLYIEEIDWREKVEWLITTATLIFIKPSNTDGLQWELKTILKKNLIHKLVISHQFSNFRSKKLNKFYYNELKYSLLFICDIEMNNYRSRSKYSYFTKDLQHHQTRSLNKILCTLNTNNR
ncbi:hypothetical protein [uncultured Kordia sp.]|uniref:hypothetical protein n=1 Tax=uncultured Kordia sp. TaxID=507699 RepID=UPI00262E5210|nr:hypothetical protein [uncultured Kordia sp.]